MIRSTHESQRRGGSAVHPAMAFLIILAGALFVPACLSTEDVREESPAAVSSADAAADVAAAQQPGPAALWARNCARCHTLQPPARYSDAKWKLVMHHMRLQCYLTGEEQRAIEQLMRSANN